MIVKYRDELLQQIAAGMSMYNEVPVQHLQVILLGDNGQEFEFALTDIIDFLATGVDFDERGNWSQIRLARVQREKSFVG